MFTRSQSARSSALLSLSAQQRAGVFMIRALSASAFGFINLRKKKPRVALTEYRYGTHPDERLDFMPVRIAERNPGEAIVYLHGGGWISCSKRFYPPDLQFLSDAGYPVFNVEYPLAPEHPHPLLFQSVLRSVAWIKQHHPRVKHIHLMGDSAGGNLAAMYGVVYSNPELLAELGGEFAIDDLLPPASVISLYGLLDRETLIKDDPDQLKPIVRLFLQSYGGPEVLRRGKLPTGQAITPMDLDWSTHPPCFLGVGDADFLLESSQRYDAVLQDLGITHTTRIYPQAFHGFFNFPHAQTPSLREDIVTFLKRL